MSQLIKSVKIECLSQMIDHLTTLQENLIDELSAWESSIVEDEKTLSDYFDDDEAHYFVVNNTVTDVPAFNEHFNNWVDMLQKDGSITSQQADEYSYVGKYQSQVN